MMRNGSSTAAPLGFLPKTIRGLVSLSLLSINTVACCAALFPVAIAKLVAPAAAVRRRIDPLLHGIARGWIAANGFWIAIVHNAKWQIEGADRLRPDQWYLVEANHQSWADIFVMQKALNGRIPLLKFSMKRQLIWVPLIGLAWWALDFPFMSRHSEAYLRKRPERRGMDLEAIRKACEKFRLVPTSVMNFLEGTRFSPEKQAAQGSTYRHLLKPKAGGIALALGAMGEKFRSLLDVTLFYPEGAPTFFEFLSGSTGRVVMVVREVPIPRELIGGDYAGDAEYRSRVRGWVEELWREKDRALEALHRAKE